MRTVRLVKMRPAVRIIRPSKHIKPPFAIIQIHSFGMTEVIFTLSGIGPYIGTDSLSFRLHGLNLNDRLHGYIILCPWIGNDLYALYVFGIKAVEFGQVAHLTSVQVNQRSSLPEHRIAIVFCLYKRYMRQDFSSTA